jgi:hypothetical protein
MFVKSLAADLPHGPRVVRLTQQRVQGAVLHIVLVHRQPGGGGGGTLIFL